MLKCIVNLVNSIKRIRRKIAQTQVVIECKNTKQKHQKFLLHRLKKKYGNSKMIT